MGRLWASVRVARIGGIPIRLHASFFAALPFAAWALGAGAPVTAALAGAPPGALGAGRFAWGLGLALALFLSVVVHELAHARYAVANGGRVRAITLLVIGGVSELLDPPRTHREEAVMAFVGPAASLVIGAAALGAFVAVRPHGAWPVALVLLHLAWANLALGLFNLIPAFPMDGGRILRGLLAGRLGLARATGVATGVGQAFALAFAAWGLFSANVVLVCVAAFVFAGADRERRDVATREALAALPLAEVVGTGAIAPLPARAPDGGPLPALAPEARADEALRVLAREGVRAVAVVDRGRLVGTVSWREIRRALRLRELAAARRERAGGRRRPVRAG